MESSSLGSRFNSPQEELAFLREEVARKEQEMENAGSAISQEQIISEKITEHRNAPPSILSEAHGLKPLEIQGIALDLSPEIHDDRMIELFALVESKGIKNALAVADAMNDPHMEDDFHRALVQYVKKGLASNLKERDPVFRSLHSTLYEIALPDSGEKEGEVKKSLKELISSMEQFYAGMLSISENKSFDKHFTIEIANANHNEESIVYASVPDHKKELFEKQILSVFPTARITEKPDDYNVFNEQGVSVGSYGGASKNAIFPLKTYDAFDHDPLNVILNAFSKINKDGEGAAVQISFNPSGDFYVKKYSEALQQVQKGESLKRAIDLPMSFGGEAFRMLKDIVAPPKAKKEGEVKGPEVKDQVAMDLIQTKVGSPIVESNIRIIASAGTLQAAERIISDIESTFNQFETTGYNKIQFSRVKGRRAKQFFKDFSFRTFSHDNAYPLNLKELSTLMHFHGEGIRSAHQLRRAKAGSAPAPLNLPQQGTLLGVNRNRNVETKACIGSEDRMRHFYTIGQTGTGKSTLLKNMITQDILQGHGVCYIDPHGVDIEDILSIIPKERYEDLIYFDPSYTPRPMGLNMLEYDVNKPEQKTFVVNELFSIFKKLYGGTPEAMGPAFEQYFRNSSLLVMEDPDTGNTLVDVGRVLSDKAYRELKLSRCKNPLVKQFWENAQKTTGDQGLANYVQYVTNKFDVFLANDIMRPVVAQEKSSFDFRDIMDNKKILLVNLAKGKLGDINSSLIGLILVGKILMAALSRVDTLSQGVPDFYLYLDEFQNVTTNSIATILSEARKYRLSLNVAHQFIAQLEDTIKDAVFGNVGSIAAFRVGADDAEYLEKQFAPVFTASDLVNVDNRNAYLKMLVDGKPVKPFNVETLAPAKGNPAIVGKLKELSYFKYGKDRAEVEADIVKKYQVAKPSATLPTQKL